MKWTEINVHLWQANTETSIKRRRAALRAALQALDACRRGQTVAVRYTSLHAAWRGMSGPDLEWYIRKITDTRCAYGAISDKSARAIRTILMTIGQIVYGRYATGSEAAKSRRQAQYLRRLFNCYGERR